MATARLAVLGSPIAHSLSPDLHRAAYRVLGLDWAYDAIELTGERLEEFIVERDETWRGLSLTMPLKRDILPLLSEASELVTQTGSANTVVFGPGGRLHGFNTDVHGLSEGFRRHGQEALHSALILGGGATAASAVVAAAQLGATSIFLGVRSPDRASGLIDVARAQGIELQVRALDRVIEIDEPLDAVISTLPNGAAVSVELDPDTVRESTLFDVAYSPWPTPLAAAWSGAVVIGGLEMLVLQAHAQVRAFVNGDPERPVERDDEVLVAMLSAVGL